jgi:predicted LPLAT superfamily acyltransferase
VARRAGDLHASEAHGGAHLETVNVARVSPNTAIVLRVRVPMARAVTIVVERLAKSVSSGR